MKIEKERDEIFHRMELLLNLNLLRVKNLKGKEVKKGRFIDDFDQVTGLIRRDLDSLNKRLTELTWGTHKEYRKIMGMK